MLQAQRTTTTVALFLFLLTLGALPGLAETADTSGKAARLDQYVSGTFYIGGEEATFMAKVGEPMRITDKVSGSRVTLAFNTFQSAVDGSVKTTVSVRDYEGPLSDLNVAKVLTERSVELSQGIEERLFDNLGVVVESLVLKERKPAGCGAGIAEKKQDPGSNGSCCVDCNGASICGCFVLSSCGYCCAGCC